jgi:hypothetical protein
VGAFTKAECNWPLDDIIYIHAYPDVHIKVAQSSKEGFYVADLESVCFDPTIHISRH